MSLWCLLLPARAAAQAIATVQRISAPDNAGRWRVVDQSGAAWRVPGGATTDENLSTGMRLNAGDVVQTREARAQIVFDNGNAMHLSEGARLTITSELSIAQELGEVYYRVKSELFGVQYATVEATVEGTRFIVMGTDAGDVVVRVEEGTVRVRSAGQESMVGRGQSAQSSGGSAPTAAQPWQAGPTGFARSWSHGRPRLLLGGLVSGAGLVGGGIDSAGALQGRAFAGLHLLGGWRLEYDLGLARATSGSTRVPQGLGLSWQIPHTGVSLGGGLTGTYEHRSADCGAEYKALHIGGAGAGRYAFTLTRRLSLLGEVRLGYAEQLSVDGAVGLAVGL